MRIIINKLYLYFDILANLILKVETEWGFLETDLFYSIIDLGELWIK